MQGLGFGVFFHHALGLQLVSTVVQGQWLNAICCELPVSHFSHMGISSSFEGQSLPKPLYIHSIFFPSKFFRYLNIPSVTEMPI